MIRYWISDSSSNWNNPSNWSQSVIPNTDETAVFTSAHTGSCGLDTTVEVAGMGVDSGYTGTIFQNRFSISIGKDGLLFSDGTFAGGGADIHVAGDISFSGGFFLSTDQTLSIENGIFSISDSSIFSHNHGILSLGNSSELEPTNGITLSTLQINGTGIEVEGSCHSTNIDLLSGYATLGSSDTTVHVLGNVYGHAGYGAWSPNNNLSILFDSTVLQYLNSETGCVFPTIVVNK
jgi:hypothetical protein